MCLAYYIMTRRRRRASPAHYITGRLSLSFFCSTKFIQKCCLIPAVYVDTRRLLIIIQRQKAKCLFVHLAGLAWPGIVQLASLRSNELEECSHTTRVFKYTKFSACYLVQTWRGLCVGWIEFGREEEGNATKWKEDKMKNEVYRGLGRPLFISNSRDERSWNIINDENISICMFCTRRLCTIPSKISSLYFP